MSASILQLVLSLVAILVACHLFTNAIEWVGRRLDLGEGIVGSVLAAIGTALPETMVPLVAILIKSGEAAEEVGIGAILGAPFMLSTLAFLVTGCSVFVFSATRRRSMHMQVDSRIMARDLSYFLLSYALVVLTGLMHYCWLHYAVGFVVLFIYGQYLRLVFSDQALMNGYSEPLFFQRHAAKPAFVPIFLQLTAAIALMLLGVHYFIEAIICVATALGVAPVVLSLIITPIATELPEKANSVIWTSQSKDTLALGNITGAMVFQSTFPVSIGLFFTEWDIDGITLVSAAIALVSGVMNYMVLRVRGSVSAWQLVLSGLLYLVFIGHVMAGVR